jgi:hypothetical protein
MRHELGVRKNDYLCTSKPPKPTYFLQLWFNSGSKAKHRKLLNAHREQVAKYKPSDSGSDGFILASKKWRQGAGAWSAGVQPYKKESLKRA